MYPLESKNSGVNLLLTRSNKNKKISNGEFADKVIHYMKEIVSENERRMTSYATNTLELNAGVFYANDYYAALKTCADKEREKRLNDPGLTKTEKEKKSLAEQRLEWLIRNGSFYHGLAPKCFSNIESTASPTGKLPSCFILKKGEKPSTSLKAMMKGLTLLGCGEAVQLAQYLALLDVLGEEKFNAVFSAEGKTPLSFGSAPEMRLAPIAILNETVGIVDNVKDVKKGDIVYFSSAPEYARKHLNGEARGYNTFCMETGSEPKFLAFGLNQQGVTTQQMSEALCREYNKAPVGDELFPEKVAARIHIESDFLIDNNLKNHKFKVEEFSEKQPRATKQIIMIDRIHQLAKKSIECAPTLLSRWVDSAMRTRGQ